MMYRKLITQFKENNEEDEELADPTSERSSLKLSVPKTPNHKIRVSRHDMLISSYGNLAKPMKMVNQSKSDVFTKQRASYRSKSFIAKTIYS